MALAARKPLMRFVVFAIMPSLAKGNITLVFFVSL